MLKTHDVQKFVNFNERVYMLEFIVNKNIVVE